MSEHPNSKPSVQSRQLAAILFADIVGYTALMQSNEQLALTALQKFKQTLEIQVTAFQGQIINFYGDGCLAIFNSSVDATACAKSLQLKFQTEPKVPVRIGLHAGDVVLRDDNVFGDAVNIASRIESMGEAGSVLLSSSVRNQIKNQPEHQLTSLGRFEFKNVEGAMTVYALCDEGFVVPQRKKLSGKQKRTEPKPRIPWKAAFAGIGAILSLVLLYYSFVSQKTPLLSDNIGGNTIAVFPFEVNGSPEIQYLGKGMVDLISTQLDEIPQLRSVDPNLVFSKLGGETAISRKLEKAAALAVSLGASEFILGSITQLDETIQINASKYNSEDGQALDKQNVKGHVNTALTQTIDELIKRLVAKEMEAAGLEISSLAALMSSNLESLKAYLRGEQAFRAGNYNTAYQLFSEATSLDSTFAIAWMRVADAATWNQQVSGAEAHRQWAKYRHTMPKKWQELYEARQLYLQADRKTKTAYERLINNYGEQYAFLNGMGEFLFHFNPVYGKSQLEAKPYLEKALELDENNLEALIHLSHIAIMEDDEARLQEFIKKTDQESQLYPLLQASLLHFKDTVTDEDIRTIVQHPKFFEEAASSVFIPRKNQSLNFPLCQRFFSIYDHEEFRLISKALEEGYSGQERASNQTMKRLARVKGYFPFPYAQYRRTVPATLMTDAAFLPHSENYEELFQACKDQNSPWDIYAAIKYALALQKDGEVTELKRKLRSLATTPRSSTMVNYYDFSLQAFEANMAGEPEKALALIDSAFQYNFGYWEIQLSCYDKSILAANIYAQQGEYEKAIPYLENALIFFYGGELLGYIDYKLSDWHEKIGEYDKALIRCNKFLDSHKDCDEKYVPWVKEVEERHKRLMAKEL